MRFQLSADTEYEATLFKPISAVTVRLKLNPANEYQAFPHPYFWLLPEEPQTLILTLNPFTDTVNPPRFPMQEIARCRTNCSFLYIQENRLALAFVDGLRSLLCT